MGPWGWGHGRGRVGRVRVEVWTGKAMGRGTGVGQPQTRRGRWARRLLLLMQRCTRPAILVSRKQHRTPSVSSTHCTQHNTLHHRVPYTKAQCEAVVTCRLTAPWSWLRCAPCPLGHGVDEAGARMVPPPRRRDAQARQAAAAAAHLLILPVCSVALLAGHAAHHSATRGRLRNEKVSAWLDRHGGSDTAIYSGCVWAPPFGTASAWLEG